MTLPFCRLESWFQNHVVDKGLYTLQNGATQGTATGMFDRFTINPSYASAFNQFCQQRGTKFLSSVVKTLKHTVILMANYYHYPHKSYDLKSTSLRSHGTSKSWARDLLGMSIYKYINYNVCHFWFIIFAMFNGMPLSCLHFFAIFCNF